VQQRDLVEEQLTFLKESMDENKRLFEEKIKFVTTNSS
jgi:hypothetical protein